MTVHPFHLAELPRSVTARALARPPSSASWQRTTSAVTSPLAGTSALLALRALE